MKLSSRDDMNKLARGSRSHGDERKEDTEREVETFAVAFDDHLYQLHESSDHDDEYDEGRYSRATDEDEPVHSR